MGYNTWLSLKKKLPNRINVVISNTYKKNVNITNNPDYIYQNFDNFMLECKKNKFFYNKNIFIFNLCFELNDPRPPRRFYPEGAASSHPPKCTLSKSPQGTTGPPSGCIQAKRIPS